MFQGIMVPSFSESDGPRSLLDPEGDGTVIIQNTHPVTQHLSQKTLTVMS